ncbi:VP4 [Gokushovirus WZ-2015a]|nr:VP4 [Gokushovirus WZ-2015a]
MSCKHPLLRFYNPRDQSETRAILGLGTAMAKYHFKGYEEVISRTDVMLIPCGKCIGCRIRAKQDWATRLELEARAYKGQAWFITLTYRDDTIPLLIRDTGELIEGGISVWSHGAEVPEQINTLNMDDMTRFWKRLRKYQTTEPDMGNGLRYFYSGEYGEQTGRPHYHAIVFGLEIPDLKKVPGRNQYYKSAILEKIWGKGNVTIAYSEPGTYNYVAGYVTKKMYGNDTKEYQNLGLTAPYACMSRKPGIAMPWLEQNLDKLWEQDYIQLAGKTAPIPRAFDKVLEQKDPERLWAKKKKRQWSAINGALQAMSQTEQTLLEQYETKDRVLMKSFAKSKGKL